MLYLQKTTNEALLNTSYEAQVTTQKHVPENIAPNTKPSFILKRNTYRIILRFLYIILNAHISTVLLLQEP
jgi:hypothetical protein